MRGTRGSKLNPTTITLNVDIKIRRRTTLQIDEVIVVSFTPFKSELFFFEISLSFVNHPYTKQRDTGLPRASEQMP